MKSVLETITAGASYLKKAGVEDARLNMEHLLAHALSCRRLDLYMQFDRPLTDMELSPLRELVKRRAGREPLQHLLGDVDFMGREFKSDSRALIPRPETELLVEEVVERLGDDFAGRLIDVGTGSGVIGLSLAAMLPDAEVGLVDLSEEALSLARENAVALDLVDRVTIRRGDLLEHEAEQSLNIQCIVANLPYITEKEMGELQEEVKFDPTLALVGGVDGLDVVRRLVQQCEGRLVSGGLLALELGLGQPEKVAAGLKKVGYADVEVKKDATDRERFVFAIL